MHPGKEWPEVVCSGLLTEEEEMVQGPRALQLVPGRAHPSEPRQGTCDRQASLLGHLALGTRGNHRMVLAVGTTWLTPGLGETGAQSAWTGHCCPSSGTFPSL